MTCVSNNSTLYYHTKTLIDFLCKQELYSKFVIQLLKTFFNRRDTYCTTPKKLIIYKFYWLYFTFLDEFDSSLIDIFLPKIPWIMALPYDTQNCHVPKWESSNKTWQTRAMTGQRSGIHPSPIDVYTWPSPFGKQYCLPNGEGQVCYACIV